MASEVQCTLHAGAQPWRQEREATRRCAQKRTEALAQRSERRGFVANGVRSVALRDKPFDGLVRPLSQNGRLGLSAFAITENDSCREESARACSEC
jgi:hypothetical protein